MLGDFVLLVTKSETILDCWWKVMDIPETSHARKKIYKLGTIAKILPTIWQHLHNAWCFWVIVFLVTKPKAVLDRLKTVMDLPETSQTNIKIWNNRKEATLTSSRYYNFYCIWSWQSSDPLLYCTELCPEFVWDAKGSEPSHNLVLDLFVFHFPGPEKPVFHYIPDNNDHSTKRA